MILLFVLALISLVVDCCQTLDIKNHSNIHESNPLLGPHPSDNIIIVYFFVCMALLVAAHWALPAIVFHFITSLVFSLEVWVIIRNVVNGCNLQFWR